MMLDREDLMSFFVMESRRENVGVHSAKDVEMLPVFDRNLNTMESLGFIGGEEVLFDGRVIVGRGRHCWKGKTLLEGEDIVIGMLGVC